MRNKICGITALILVLLQVFLIMASWIITAAMPELSMHSLLSAEGVRWLFGHFVDNLSSHLLVDIILLMIGLGSIPSSGLSDGVKNLCLRNLQYGERVGLEVVFAELIVAIVVVGLLVGIPHGVLLSVTGHLFPSSFSVSLVPIISLTTLTCSLTFGIVSGRIETFARAYETIIYGIKHLSWLLPIYILAAELYYSVIYVLPVLN